MRAPSSWHGNGAPSTAAAHTRSSRPSHGFHGRTLATMSASGKAAWDGLFEPRVAGFPKVPLNDLEAVEAAIGDKTIAIMLEPIQGESGVWPAEDTYLRSLRSLADRRGVLLIFDEIQTGMGRTGALFCFEHTGVRLDIMTLGKGIGAGTPLAALLAREAVCCFDPGDQGGTYNGNALMAAVGQAVLEQITAEGFLERVCEAGAVLRRGLESLSEKYGLSGVRGRGAAPRSRPEAAGGRIRPRREGAGGRPPAQRPRPRRASLRAGA